MHPHRDKVENYPTDVRLFDRKMWSNFAVFHRCIIPPDATNFVYWKCVVLLVAGERTLHWHWKELLRYMNTSKLPRGNDGRVLWDEIRSRDFLSDAGDIYEAIAGFCMPHLADSRELRALLEHRGEVRALLKSRGEEEDIESESQFLLSTMGKLAECIYLLVYCAPWPVHELDSLLTENVVVGIRSTDDDTSDDWKSRWVEVYWPELSSKAGNGTIRHRPDAQKTVTKPGTAAQLPGDTFNYPKTGMRMSTAAQLPRGEEVSRRSGAAQTGNGGAVALNNTNAAQKTSDVITALEGWGCECSPEVSRASRRSSVHDDFQKANEKDSASEIVHRPGWNDESPWDSSSWWASSSWDACHRDPETEWMKRRRLQDGTRDSMSMSQSWEQRWWQSDPRQSSDRRWTEDSGWESSSWRGSERQKRPARLPVEEGDRRFASEKRSRVYICDNCGSRNEYQHRAMPFDGQYLKLLEIRGRTPEALKQAYENGEVDATWFCTRCHQRDDEYYEATRRRIEVYQLDRIIRTTKLLDSGFRWHN